MVEIVINQADAEIETYKFDGPIRNVNFACNFFIYFEIKDQIRNVCFTGSRGDGGAEPKQPTQMGGSQYACHDYQKRLKAYYMVPSMRRNGNC